MNNRANDFRSYVQIEENAKRKCRSTSLGLETSAANVIGCPCVADTTHYSKAQPGRKLVVDLDSDLGEPCCEAGPPR